ELRANSYAFAPVHVMSLDLSGAVPPELIVRVIPSVAFVVKATYPDGTRVSPDHCQVVFSDPSGELQLATGQDVDGWQFIGAIGYEHAFFVRATGLHGEADTVYRATGTALSPGPLPDGKATVDLTVVLAATDPEEVAPPAAGLPLLRGLDQSGAAWVTWHLQFVDA